MQNLVELFDGKKKAGEELADMLDYQWQFIPVLNPDGYQRFCFVNNSSQYLVRAFRSHMKDADGEGNWRNFSLRWN